MMRRGSREPVAAESFKPLERALGELPGVAVFDHAIGQLGLEFRAPPVNLKVAMDLRSWSASPAAADLIETMLSINLKMGVSQRFI